MDRARPAGPIHHGRSPSRDQRGLAVEPRLASGMGIFAILFGVPVWGFAVLWIALAAALTVRTLRRGIPFALTWWSLTFPVGTFVTGTTQLALHTGLPAFRVAAAAAYVGLLATSGLVAVRTARCSLRGNLFLPPPSTARDQSRPTKILRLHPRANYPRWKISRKAELQVSRFTSGSPFRRKAGSAPRNMLLQLTWSGVLAKLLKRASASSGVDGARIFSGGTGPDTLIIVSWS